MPDQYPLPISTRYIPGLKNYHDADDYFAKEGSYPDFFDPAKAVKRWTAAGTSFQTPNSEAPGGLVSFNADGPSLNLPGQHTHVVKPAFVPPTTTGTYDAGQGVIGIVPWSAMARTSDVELLVSRLGPDASFVDQDVVTKTGKPVPVVYSDDQAKYYAIKFGSLDIAAYRLVKEMYDLGPGKYSLVNGALVSIPVPTEPVPGAPPEVPIPVQLHDGEVLHFAFGGVPWVYAADQVPNSGGPAPATPAAAAADLSALQATLFEMQQTLNQILAAVQK